MIIMYKHKRMLQNFNIILLFLRLLPKLYLKFIAWETLQECNLLEALLLKECSCLFNLKSLADCAFLVEDIKDYFHWCNCSAPAPICRNVLFSGKSAWPTTCTLHTLEKFHTNICWHWSFSILITYVYLVTSASAFPQLKTYTFIEKM